MAKSRTVSVNTEHVYAAIEEYLLARRLIKEEEKVKGLYDTDPLDHIMNIELEKVY